MELNRNSKKSSGKLVENSQEKATSSESTLHPLLTGMTNSFRDLGLIISSFIGYYLALMSWKSNSKQASFPTGLIPR